MQQIPHRSRPQLDDRRGPGRRSPRHIAALLSLCGCLLGGLAHGADPTGAVSSFDAGSLRFATPIEAPGWTLFISGPDGFHARRQFEDETPTFDLFDAGPVTDGSYHWELRPSDAALLSPAAIGKGRFRVSDGAIVLPDGSVRERTKASGPIPPESLAPNHVGDFYIDGRLAFGTEIDGTESLGFATMLVEEDNIRLKFADTSTSTGFPSVDWQVTINDSFTGGGSYFAVEDLTNSTVPFRVDDQAPTDSLRVDQNGRVGIGLSTPATELHVMGDTTLEGDFSVLSSRTAKEALEPVDAKAVLARLAELAVVEWSYRGSPDVRHLGPVAEDFREAFQLGRNARSIHPLDVAGVALVAIQALRTEVDELGEGHAAATRLLADRDARIARLEEDRRVLEERLEALEELVRNQASR